MSAHIAGQSRLTLAPVQQIGAAAALSLPVIFGFVIPASVLLSKVDFSLSAGAARGLDAAMINTFGIAVAGALITTFVAVLLAYAARTQKNAIAQVLLRISTLGYAIPGAVIAIGILALTSGMANTFGFVSASGVGVLLYAYAARFITAGYNAAAGGLTQISPQIDAVARSLGASQTKILSRVHWPLSRTAILSGSAIIAIDIAKELPATLLLRPFNFETLATHVYRLASDERLADASPAALLLILFGLAPTLLLSFTSTKNNARRR